MIDFEAQWLRLARSLEKERASGSMCPRLITQTPHRKVRSYIDTLLVVSKI
jgi:hypothetical protein